MASNEYYKTFQRKVNLFLDNQLEESQKNQLLQKAQKDPNCNSILHDEVSFRTIVKSNIKRCCASNNLKDNIKAKIEIS